jgi:hypothetical protein
MKRFLIPDARKAWKFWSVRLQILGTTIVSVFVMVPEAALTVWNNFPADLKALLPSQYMPMIGAAICITAVVARVIRQRKLGEIQNGSQSQNDQMDAADNPR